LRVLRECVGERLRELAYHLRGLGVGIVGRGFGLVDARHELVLVLVEPERLELLLDDGRVEQRRVGFRALEQQRRGALLAILALAAGFDEAARERFDGGGEVGHLRRHG